ncbi:MAG: hypothetical protein LBR65_10245 [Culturomica sp.]|jgi:hypothetical protein|nr:hypothetical protein [Culturomica sp.]
MKQFILFTALFVPILLFSSCATLFSGTKQQVSFSASQNGVMVKDKKTGNNLCMAPCMAPVPRRLSRTFVFEKEGYNPSEVQLKGGFNFNTLWNILFFPPLLAIDFADGAAWKYNHPSVYASLVPSDSYVKDPTIREGEATKMVTRDNPGGTALERTIIRWHFDSEPRGARIFWRIISSIPDQVKNTNELYLTSTPYEETRSFNILGLTYENSRDVVVEIKVTSPGYMDQVKRYNLRQAIDQQEISGFFDLVQKP